PSRGAVRPIGVLLCSCRHSYRASGLGMGICALLDPILVRGARSLAGIKMAALLDFSAAVFLGFFASRFDFLFWPLAISPPSCIGEFECSARPVSMGGSETT